MRHDAQLRICHEKIGTVLERLPWWYRSRYPRQKSWRWCDLSAYAWCFDESMYVCEVHYQANHALHRTQLVSEEH